MSGRRARAPPSRGTESTQQPVEGAVTRQTRSSSKRAEVTVVVPESKSPKSPRNQSKIPQRGTRRRRRRSLESVATNDFPKSSADYASPERPAADVPKSSSAVNMENPDNMTVAAAESQSESDDDAASVLLQDVLEYGLPRLRDWCERTYEALVALTSPESTAEDRKKLKSTTKLFKIARRIFAENSAAYIDISSSDLPFTKDSDSYARIQKAALSANLVSLLLSLGDVRNSKKGLQDFLQELDEAIPLFFEPGLLKQSESSYMRFRVRCGRLVELVGSAPNVQPLVLATVLFCQQPTETLGEAKKRLRKGPFKDFGHIEQDEDFTSTEMFRAQMDEIINKLSLSERAEAVEALNLLYPQDELLEELQNWGNAAYAHLKKTRAETTEENVEKGADKDADALIDANDREENGESRREESVPLLGKQADEAEEQSESESSSEGGEYNQLQTVSKEPSFIQDAAALAAVRRSEQRGSERSRVKPRPMQQVREEEPTASQTINAIRQLRPSQIFGSSNPSHENGDPTGAATAGRSGSVSPSVSTAASQELGTSYKRMRTIEEEDGDYEEDEEEERREREERQASYYDDENDDFEVNEQVINESRRIRPDNSRVSRPAPKRGRFTGNNPRSAAGPVPPSSPEAPAAIDLRNSDLLVLSQTARANRAAGRVREPQTREKWTSAETNHLLDLIADPTINCSWAAMEKRGGFRVHRNQQAIRDRARNLKKWYLCADTILPSGFDFVFLSKKEKEEVIASGHNPRRKEGDIADDGTVTNNLWSED